MASRMFYTIMQYEIYWKQAEDITEATRTLWGIIQNMMEGDGNTLPWKLLVLYKVWAQLTPTLTHMATCDPMTSDAESGQ